MRVPLPLTIFAAIALASACAAATPSTAPGGGGSPATSGVTCGATGTGTAISIVNFAFQPTQVTVKAGGFVTWTNNSGGTTHTVTFDNGPDCGHVASGASVTAQFSTPGTFAFHCNIHPSMKASVTVTG